MLSSLSCFKDYMTLVSYVPKKNKAVIMLSTYHHANQIAPDEINRKKPEMILDYNKYKGFFLFTLIYISKI